MRTDAGEQAGMKAYHEAWRAKKKQDPEWVAREAAKHEARKQDPEWLEQKRAYYREYAKAHRDKFRERLKADPDKWSRTQAKLKEYAKAHPEKIKSAQKKHIEKARQENPLKVIISYVRTRAKKRGIEFNLEPSDLVMPEVCPVLGIPIVPFKGKFNPNSASFDRKDPAKGYIRGNVEIVSWRANMLKRDCTDAAELRAVADYIERCQRGRKHEEDAY